MSQYEIHKMMKDLPSQAGHYTRLHEIIAGALFVALCIFVITI